VHSYRIQELMMALGYSKQHLAKNQQAVHSVVPVVVLSVGCWQKSTGPLARRGGGATLFLKVKLVPGTVQY